MGSVSKHRAIVKDRISALPDALLCHILSFLRTKYAVRTTILSKRWNKMWTYVPILDLRDQEDFRTVRTDGYGSALFTNFVDRVLLFRQSSDIRKFRLSLRHFDAYSRIDGWICTAIRRNVVELDFYLCVEDDDITFELPRCVFMCKTLEVLKLTSNCIICAPPPSGCFSSLKFLHVSVCYPDSDWVANMFSHCPVLEGLIIDGNIGLDRVLNFNISAPNLKTLKIDLEIDGLPDDPAYNIYINAPKLENLDVKVDKLSNCYMEDAKSLIKAVIVLEVCDVEKWPAFANRVTALLALLSNVKYLSLSAHYMEYNMTAEEVFDSNLFKLALHECCCWHWLPVLLKALHKLEDLALEGTCGTCKKAGFAEKGSLDIEDGVSEDTTKWNEKYSQHEWNPPEFVPICLASHLKSLSIRGFKGRPVEMEVAKYLLKNCKVLNKVAIHACPHTKPEELHKELVTFQRGSATCQVEWKGLLLGA